MSFSLPRSGFGLAVFSVFASAMGGCGGGSGGNPSATDVVLLTATLPSGQTGVAYDAFIEASFAHPPGIYLRIGGTLPPGLDLDPQTGEITGFPRQVGTFRFEVEARDGIDPQAPRDFTFPADRRQYTIEVTRGLPNFIPPFTLDPAQYRAQYSHVFDVAGGLAPYTFEFVGGELPAGLEVKPTGILGDFPTAARQDPYVFDVRVTDSNGDSDVETFTLQVVILPLIIGTPAVPEAAADFPYSFAFSLASPGGGVPYTWSQVTPGPGETDLASIDMEITPAGVLRNKPGTDGPSAAGSYVFTVGVTDQALQAAPPRSFTLEVNPGPVLSSITPNRAVQPGPYIVTGLNFQPGAALTFNPGQPSEQTITPIFDSATQLRFNSAPALSVSGFVPVKVTNPDNGAHTKPAAFGYPATTFDFENVARAPIPNSPLSSTGLAVADVNADGFGDIVHCGTSSGGWSNASGTAGGVDVLLNAPAGGTFDKNNPTFTRIVLATGDYHEVAFADVNTDGKPDVVAVGSFSGVRQVRAWLNGYTASTPAFVAGQSPIVTQLQHQGDASGTGHIGDIALGSMTPSDTVPDLAYVYQDTPGRILTPVVGYFGSTYYQYTEAGGTVSTVRGLGGGAFAATNLKTGQLIANLFSAAGVSLGNFNGDTLVDIHVSDESNDHTGWWTGGGNTGRLGVFALTDGTGLFGDWTPTLHGSYTDTYWTQSLGTATGDVNGDGRDDVIVASGTNFNPDGSGSSNWGQPSLATFAGQGSGTFSELAIIKPSIRYRYNTVFDGNFDLSNEVAVSGGIPGAFNKIDVYQGRGGSSGLLFKEQLVATVGSPNIGRVAAGDVDGDGKPDLVACLSMFADAQSRTWPDDDGGGYPLSSSYADRGNGSTMGVTFFLNTSN